MAPAVCKSSGRHCVVKISTGVSAACTVTFTAAITRPPAVSQGCSDRPDAEGELLVSQRPAAGADVAQLGATLTRVRLPVW
jgi:hypothetical protein